MHSSSLALALAVTAATAFTATAAKADLLTSATNGDAQSFVAGESFMVVIDGTGGKKVAKFKTNKATKVLIQFFAECSVDGFVEDWLDIDILVDKAGAGGFEPIPPTDDDNAMCTGFEPAPNGTDDRWLSAVVAGVVEVPKGTHKVKVQGYLNGGGFVRLDDILLTVQE